MALNSFGLLKPPESHPSTPSLGCGNKGLRCFLFGGKVCKKMVWLLLFGKYFFWLKVQGIDDLMVYVYTFIHILQDI